MVSKPYDIKKDPNIMRYKTSVLNDMESRLKTLKRLRFSTTKGERKTLRSLKKNTDIIIKPADKGEAIVIMNEEDYIKEGRQPHPPHPLTFLGQYFAVILQQFCKLSENLYFTFTTNTCTSNRVKSNPVHDPTCSKTKGYMYWIRKTSH